MNNVPNLGGGEANANDGVEEAGEEGGQDGIDMLEIITLKVFDIKCFPKTKLKDGFMDKGGG